MQNTKMVLNGVFTRKTLFSNKDIPIAVPRLTDALWRASTGSARARYSITDNSILDGNNADLYIFCVATWKSLSLASKIFGTNF